MLTLTCCLWRRPDTSSDRRGEKSKSTPSPLSLGGDARYASRTVLRKRIFHCIVAFAFAGSGCAVNPVTGRPELSMMSPEREAELGAEAAQQVAASIGLVEDPELQAYVEALGQRLAQHSPRRDVTYRFAIADMP